MPHRLDDDVFTVRLPHPSSNLTAEAARASFDDSTATSPPDDGSDIAHTANSDAPSLLLSTVESSADIRIRGRVRVIYTAYLQSGPLPSCRGIYVPLTQFHSQCQFEIYDSPVASSPDLGTPMLDSFELANASTFVKRFRSIGPPTIDISNSGNLIYETPFEAIQAYAFRCDGHVRSAWRYHVEQAHSRDSSRTTFDIEEGNEADQEDALDWLEYKAELEANCDRLFGDEEDLGDMWRWQVQRSGTDVALVKLFQSSL